MLAVIFSLMMTTPANAILTEPTYHAADALGYLVVGEIEFPPGKSEPDRARIQDQVREIGEICPRTNAYERGVSSFARLVLLAWSDREFPTRRAYALAWPAQQLALKRARSVAENLRAKMQGPLSFELVNMATRKPHPIQVAEAARVRESRYDVKAAMEIAGGAPSDAYGMGLFGENGQRSKVIIWVDCKESFGQRRRGTLANLQLASTGAVFK